jgi:hypothetical protein
MYGIKTFSLPLLSALLPAVILLLLKTTGKQKNANNQNKFNFIGKKSNSD